LLNSFVYSSKGISVGKRSAGVSGAIGRHNLNDEELVNKNCFNE
jgi:hypothetical protein